MDEHSVNRRQWLKATGAGTGIAFVGTTGAMRSRTAVDSFQPQFTTMDDVEEIADCETEIQQLLFAFDADSEDDDPIEVEPGDEFDDILDEFDVDLEPEGRVFEDGTWELDPIDVIIDDPEGSLDTLFDLLEEFGDDDFDFDPDDIEDFIGGIDGFVEIRLGNQDDATQPIDGLFDPENEIVTADLKLSVEVDLTIDLDVPIFDPDDIEVDLELDVEATLTTDESGEMEGSYEEVADDELQLELVANDFLVPETNTVIVLDLPDIPGVDLPVPDEIDVDEEAGLPSPVGRNFLRLTLGVFFDPEIPDMTGDLEGVIADDIDNPIPNAEVEVVSVTTGETLTEDDFETDDDGEYVLTDLAAGPYDVFADASGFREGSGRFFVLAGKIITPILNLREDALDDTGTVNGLVLDENGNPVPGVEVELVNTLDPENVRETGITDDDGQFSITINTIDTDNPVSMWLYGSVDGYRQIDRGLSVPARTVIEPEIVLELLRGTIEGTVYDENGTVEGIDVDIIDRADGSVVETVVTNDHGQYEVELPIGAYDVRVERMDGDIPKRATESVSTEDGETRFVNLEMQIPPGILTGTVTYDGNTVADAAVVVKDGDESIEGVESDEDGSYELSVPHGEYTLEASAEVDDGEARGFTQMSIEPDEQLDMDVELVLGPPAIGPFANPPVDLNGDGRYEGIRGEEELTVADVQAFFDHIDDPAIAENPGFFNFSEIDSESVSIFDVQALFDRYQNKSAYDIPE